MIRVPNMDTPHDWLLALESEVLRGVDQSESTSKFSERMIFSTDEWIREISCRTFDRAFLHSSKSNGALRVSTVHSFTLGLNDTQTEKIPSQPV